MIHHKMGELEYFTFERFDRTGLVHHCFSTKKGGVSTGVYSSLNLGLSRGDDRDLVLENYKRICEANDIDMRNIVMARQTHQTNIKKVTEADRGTGFYREYDFENIDGFVTDCPGVALTVFFADCVPLYFLDPVKKVIGLTHAGWRGTVNGISTATVAAMEEYGCHAEDILVGIGPSIGKCCFEVDAPVVSEFEKLEFGKDYIQKDAKPGKYKIDLWGVNARLLQNCGIKKQNITVSGLCTQCHHDLFYSHRVMGDQRGSLAALMELV